jgi:hypothetical protein
MPFCHPSQDKEGRFDPAIGQDLQQALGVAFYSARQTFPIAPVNRRGEGFDLKIILDVDRHCVGETAAHPLAGGFFDRPGGWSLLQPFARQLPKRLGRLRHGRSLWK